MENRSSGGGIGIGGILTIIFVVLKLLNLIDWSWVWVLSPLWIGAIIVVVILIIGLIKYWLDWSYFG